jgi:hypothetical protein
VFTEGEPNRHTRVVNQRHLKFDRSLERIEFSKRAKIWFMNETKIQIE